LQAASIKEEKDMMRLKRFFGLLPALVTLLSLPAGNTQAALLDVGPTVPQVINSTEPNVGHGFPLWYRDTNRVPLQLCLDKSGMCLTAEPNTAAPFSFPGNLGDELRWGADAYRLSSGAAGAETLLVRQ
jgi:hypothetical protein